MGHGGGGGGVRRPDFGVACIGFPSVAQLSE